MRIDLHVHTSLRSPCSAIEPETLIREAHRRGLDGICLTEHQVIWKPDEIEFLTRSGPPLKIFRGNEFTTNQGDILVFGYDEDVKELLLIQDLREAVLKVGGFMIAAHPFRGFKTFGIGQLEMTPEQGARRRIFNFVDAIEIGNGKLSAEENEMAEKVSQILGLPGVVGSDAHRIDEIGRWVMDFERDIETESELIEEMKAGNYKVVKPEQQTFS